MHTPTGVILALVVKLVLSSQRNGSEQAPLLLGRSLLGAATGGTRDVSVAAEERRVFQSSLISGKTAGVLGGSLLHELEETGVDRGKGKVQPEHGTEAERQSQNLDIERIRVPGILFGLAAAVPGAALGFFAGSVFLTRFFTSVLYIWTPACDTPAYERSGNESKREWERSGERGPASGVVMEDGPQTATYHGRLDSHRRRNSEHGGNRDHRARASDICDDVLIWGTQTGEWAVSDARPANQETQRDRQGNGDSGPGPRASRPKGPQLDSKTVRSTMQTYVALQRRQPSSPSSSCRWHGRTTQS